MRFYKLFIFLTLYFPAQIIGQVEVLFSPQDHPTKRLIELIDKSKKRICAAIYMLTDKGITQALIRAKGRNVEIKIIFDKISVESPWGKANPLLDSGIALFLKISGEPKRRTRPSLQAIILEDKESKILQTPQPKLETAEKDKKMGFNFGAIMHNKYAIIDDLVWTGSFNWTVSANNKNDENVLIISQESAVLDKFLADFEHLLSSSVKLDKQMIKDMQKSINPMGNKTLNLPDQLPSIEQEEFNFRAPYQS